MKYLYTIPTPGQSQPAERTIAGKELSTKGAVDVSSAVVDAIASQATDLTLEGQYRWGRSTSVKLASELDELADSSITEVPLFDDSDEFGRPGYYAIDEADVKPVHGNNRSAWQYRLSLKLEGTRRTHLRSVETSPAAIDQDVATPTSEEPLVGIDARATLVRWYNPTSGALEAATPVDSVETEFGDVDRYDPEASLSASASTTTRARSPQRSGTRERAPGRRSRSRRATGSPSTSTSRTSARHGSRRRSSGRTRRRVTSRRSTRASTAGGIASSGREQ